MNERTVVITGGTRGIGRAVAEAFAEEGATTVVGSRDAAAVEETVAALADAHPTFGEGDDDATTETEDGPPVDGVRADARDEFDVERLMERASRTGETRGIDIVVAAAGVYHGTAGETPLTEDSYTAFDDHWRTNARGVFVTITEALAHLNDGARILLPTGGVARAPTPGVGSYAVSKAGGEAVIRGFAADRGFDHVVGCLDPGSVDTELRGGEGRDPASVAELFLWAATEAEPEALDGSVVDLAEWERARG